MLDASHGKASHRSVPVHTVGGAHLGGGGLQCGPATTKAHQRVNSKSTIAKKRWAIAVLKRTQGIRYPWHTPPGCRCASFLHSFLHPFDRDPTALDCPGPLLDRWMLGICQKMPFRARL